MTHFIEGGIIMFSLSPLNGRVGGISKGAFLLKVLWSPFDMVLVT